MEIKGPDPFSGIGNPDSNNGDLGVSTSTDDQQTALGKMFFAVLNRIMDTAKENSNTGA